MKKSESTNILTIEVREHVINNYQNHIKIFTDGSVLDSLDSGAGFVIPELKVQTSFYLGKVFSIFTSELYAILMALNYIYNIQLAIYLFFLFICVDSKSVLHALKIYTILMALNYICNIQLAIKKKSPSVLNQNQFYICTEKLGL